VRRDAASVVLGLEPRRRPGDPLWPLGHSGQDELNADRLCAGPRRRRRTSS
jgi:hypothetical protein